MNTYITYLLTRPKQTHCTCFSEDNLQEKEEKIKKTKKKQKTKKKHICN